MHPELVHFVRVLPEPALLVDGAGKILFANPAAAELSGLQSAQPSDARLDALISDPPEKLAEYLRLCARSRQLVPGSFRWRGRSGHDLDVRCDGTVVSPRTDSEPALLLIRCRPRAEATDQFVLLNQKIAALTQEIIERRKAELQRDELLRRERDSRLEAERIGRLKDEFLATLSHELRTPLHAILGWSQLLQRSSFDADQIRTGLQTIERNARAQSQIIDDLLDMSRIVSGKIRLDVQSVQLPALIEAAVDAVRPAADARGVRIQVTLDPLAGPVKGDPNRLQQVVWNLLTNAVKFTPRGGRVQVILERVNSHVEIVVSDTGQGIKPEFLPHLFERFRQADASTTRQHAGLGLGLSIVRHLVELHGGTVRAKSPGEGKGATFSVMLPLLAVHAADAQEIAERRHPLAAPALPEPQMPGLHGLRVLVVDDEPDARELLRHVLEERGAVVSVAASALEALDAFEAQPPQLVICDIGMAGIDGYELVRRIRARPPELGGRIPAVAVTAFARTEDRTRALLAGFNAHLAKPIDSSELVAALASLAALGGTSSAT